MSKMMQLLIFVGLFVFTATAHAGVTLDINESINSQGNNIFTITANSDGAPITSLGIHIWSNYSVLGQVHPFGVATPLQDINPFMPGLGVNVDQDTQALFATAADSLLVVSGSVDTIDELVVNFTGFAPFQSRDIVQIVATEPGLGIFDFYFTGHGGYEIGVVAGGVEYTFVSPEPASMGLFAIAGLALIRRR